MTDRTLGTFRILRARWNAFGSQANRAHHNRSQLLNMFVAWYCREPGAQLPTRPPGD